VQTKIYTQYSKKFGREASIFRIRTADDLMLPQLVPSIVRYRTLCGTWRRVTQETVTPIKNSGDKILVPTQVIVAIVKKKTAYEKNVNTRSVIKYTVPINSRLYVSLSVDLHHVSCGHDT